MSATRLYTAFAFVMMMALVSVSVMALPMLAGALNGAAAASPVSADDARLIQRRGEWTAGAAAADPEIARLAAYSNSLAEQARLAQRRGEWTAGAAVAQPVALEFQRYAWYHSSVAIARSDQLEQIKDQVGPAAVQAWRLARLDQLAAIKDQGFTAYGPAGLDVENARLAWRANH